MMNVCSISFVLLLLTASAAFFWIPTVRARQAFLALANFGFLYSQIQIPPTGSLATFLIIGFSCPPVAITSVPLVPGSLYRDACGCFSGT